MPIDRSKFDFKTCRTEVAAAQATLYAWNKKAEAAGFSDELHTPECNFSENLGHAGNVCEDIIQAIDYVFDPKPKAGRSASSRLSTRRTLSEAKIAAPKKIAALTPAEDKAWIQAFNMAVESGKTDAQADLAACAAIKREFPRLRAYDGFK